MENLRDLIDEIREADLVRREQVGLRAGEQSDYYIDIKKGYGDPFLLEKIAFEIAELTIRGTTCIAASGHGGIPLAVMVAQETKVPVAFVRSEPKDHGLDSMIDGYVPNEDDYVTVVDDVFTTGSSLRRTMEVLEDTKANILGCCVVVKRGEGELSVPLTYLFKAEDIL